MNKPVYAKCMVCANYNQEYVNRRSNEEYPSSTLHGCGSELCSAAMKFQEFEPKPCCSTKAELEGSTKAALEGSAKAALEGSAKTSTHYQVGTKQPIEIMQEIMTPEEFQGFCRGNVIKYSLRLGHKDAPVKEAAKIEQYSKWLRMSLEGKTINPMED